MMATTYGEIKEFEDSPAMRVKLAHPVHRELLFFRYARHVTGYEGPGVAQHGMNVADLIWRRPNLELFDWNPWLVRGFKEHCENDEIILAGPSSASKTFGAALYALLFWMCAPMETGVLTCSTTVDGLEKRIWGEIKKLFIAFHNIREIRAGNLVNSKRAIQTTKGDMKLGLFGLAVALGEETKALGRIIGFHPPRILVIVDELTEISWAIVEACVNLFAAKKRKQFIGIGNPLSHFDSHGKMAEPENGWDSVDVNTDRAKTKRGGMLVHFDGFKSPNLVGPAKYSYLITQADIDKTASEYGENSPQMWRMRRGWWCPEGTVRTILTESIIQKFRCMEKATWRGDYTLGASLDPSFEGGDLCVLRRLKWGIGEDNTEQLELGEIFIVKVDLTSHEPIHYQIARQVKSKCIEWGVEVHNFGLDSTGEGGGLASIIATEWAPGFVQVEFGGRASDLPVSSVNSKPCHEEYYNRVTELWHTFRTSVMSNQVRGLDPDTAIQFCTRLFTVEAKIRLESKVDMKKRLNGRSPDKADNAVVALAVARQRGGMALKATSAGRETQRNWEKLVDDFTMDEEESFTYTAIENL